MNVYHVIYITTSGVNADAFVSASSETNAAAAAQAADSTWEDLVSITTVAENIVVGS